MKAMNTEKEKWHLPHLGQRIVKTAMAVFVCQVIYLFMRGTWQEMGVEAAITAIICMQPFVQDTREYAVNRFFGTIIGAGWGVLFLFVFSKFPVTGQFQLLRYLLTALGVLISLYTAVLLGRADASSLAAIVFLCIVIAFPEVENPLRRAGARLLAVFIGTTVAVLVNLFRLPRSKNRDCVFFVRSKDLAPDRFSSIPPAALYRLNYLYNDGAKICLMLEHAPAFFTLQMSQARLSVPLIVMDGAAIYDATENVFLQTETIDSADSAQLERRLDALGYSYFIYTVHRNKTCIFHRGETTDEERTVLERMRRSPYRSYLEGEIYDPNEIVYYKILAPDSHAREIEESLRGDVENGKLRCACRPQAGSPGISGVYIYSSRSTMEQAQDRLMDLLHKKEPELRPVEIRSRYGYRSERDAIHLLHKLENRYEPIKFFNRKR